MSAGSAQTTEIRASLTLLAATVLALVIANSALAPLYKDVLASPLNIGFGSYALTDTVKGWIKNALMAVFFVFVGLEIKAEFAEGALSDRRRALLPFAGAAGGMLVPALIYLGFAGGTSAYVAGWAIPSATDIAFAVGVVGLLGTRLVPPALKAFLLAVAVIDDLGAILIIAVAYSSGLGLSALLLSALVVALLAVMNQRGVVNTWAYLAVGVVLWLLVLKSGINPTLAGVITALFVPLNGVGGLRPLDGLIKTLKYPVLFGIMPIFALANAGVSLSGLGLADLTHPVASGIAMGLLLGKPVGIALAVWLCVRAGLAQLPDGSSWLHMLGITCIAGIGFTMSLFIGVLAFGEGDLLTYVRVGVLLGSTLSALAGIAVLVVAARRTKRA
jgi:Na+:H+ antiporter, NhaA family